MVSELLDGPMQMVTNIWNDVGWQIYAGLRLAYWQWRSRNKGIVLGRYACLGADVLKEINPHKYIINVQKGRADYVVDCASNPKVRAKARLVARHMRRRCIIPCIVQEELLYQWRNPKQPSALIMDSMAELGDQLFTHRTQQWRFLCAYSDVAHTEAFKASFETIGLLPIEQLYNEYVRFFSHIRSAFGAMPIVFMHFPATLESRDKYRVRHYAIRDAIERVSKDFKPFFSLAVDDALVARAEHCAADMREFAYHYNRKTYEAFASMVRATGVLL